MKRRAFHLILAAWTLFGLAACGGGDGGSSTPSSVMTVDSSGTSTVDIQALSATLATYPLSALSSAEVDSLLYMREEEQMAHDVYAVSATLWSQPIFANIRDSEASHSAAMKLLLDRYQVADPLAGLPNGSFKSPFYQTLYAQLVAASRLSLLDALKVGMHIEELDIRDITTQMTSIDNADILMVYDHLLRGSRNHLRAFMKVLTSTGGTYVPQYISQAEFDAIVSSPIETGR